MTNEQQAITEAVRERYGAIAAQVAADQPAGCCGTTSCCENAQANPISANLYAVDELEGVPLKATLASLGCGNPTALTELRPGEVVLDLGSGGGIDVLLSARRVGPTGLVYGLDMTDEMLDLARRNAEEAGVTNVIWLKGDIGAIPLPDASVDVVISNCVINLASDKQPVFQEAFRVLKPGGRFAVSDIVIHDGLPSSIGDGLALRRDLSAWAGCIAGALTDAEYCAGLAAAGFSAINLEITRRYSMADLGAAQTYWTQQYDAALVADIAGRFASTFVRAIKPDPAGV